jgi:hypothetical protein
MEGQGGGEAQGVADPQKAVERLGRNMGASPSVHILRVGESLSGFSSPDGGTVVCVARLL